MRRLGCGPLKQNDAEERSVSGKPREHEVGDGAWSSLLGTEAQRASLVRIAELVEQHYFDETVARRCAEDVRRLPIEPTHTSATRFAERVTETLQPYDRHFRVQWGAWQSRVRREPAVDADAPALEGSVRDGIGTLLVRSFEDADDAREAKVALAALKAISGADAVVLDLRDVPGGWPTMVEFLIGAFVGAEPVHILTFRSREGSMESWSRTVPDTTGLADKPLAVFVDGGTASAAESCAYALQSLGRAKVVGESTAGAANPGAPLDTGLGFTVFVSTGSPVDPRTGANWEEVGVVPDVLSQDPSPVELRKLLL